MATHDSVPGDNVDPPKTDSCVRAAPVGRVSSPSPSSPSSRACLNPSCRGGRVIVYRIDDTGYGLVPTDEWRACSACGGFGVRDRRAVELRGVREATLMLLDEIRACVAIDPSRVGFVLRQARERLQIMSINAAERRQREESAS